MAAAQEELDNSGEPDGYEPQDGDGESEAARLHLVLACTLVRSTPASCQGSNARRKP